MDYTNDSFIRNFYAHTTNKSIDDNLSEYQNYNRYMKIIGLAIAENIQSFDTFENTSLFRDFSGEDLLRIAFNV